jgi:hypothetical protein
MTTVGLKQYKKYNPELLEDKINPERDNSVAYTCLPPVQVWNLQSKNEFS